MKLLNTLPICLPANRHFGYLDILDHGQRVDYFEDENLNVAASYVRLFAEDKGKSDWFHVVVRLSAFDAFAEAVSKRKTIKCLPFSRVCGCTERNRHRHVLVVSSVKYDFEKHVWNVAKILEAPELKSFRPLNVVDSPLKLVQTLGFLCGESECGGWKTHVVYKSLPVDYALPLCLQWPKGLSKLLYREWFGTASTLEIVRGGGLIGGGGAPSKEKKWKQKIKRFAKYESGLVLPLRKDCGPTTAKTLSFCYVNRDRKLYFDVFPEYSTLNESEWLKKQVAGGNSFYDAVGDDFWIPNKKHQEKMSLVIPLVRNNLELKKEIERLKRKCGEMT